MEYTVFCEWDPEAGVWYSESDQIPIGLESPSLDRLIEKVRMAAPELAELNGLPLPSSLSFVTQAAKRATA